MSDDQKINGEDKQPTAQQKQQAIVQAAAVSLAGQANLMLAFDVPLATVVNLLCDVACNLVSAVEPAQLRQNITSEMIKNLPHIIDRHYQARHTTPGGLIVPGR
jgi:hypothetical protein